MERNIAIFTLVGHKNGSCCPSGRSPRPSPPLSASLPASLLSDVLGRLCLSALRLKDRVSVTAPWWAWVGAGACTPQPLRRRWAGPRWAGTTRCVQSCCNGNSQHALDGRATAVETVDDLARCPSRSPTLWAAAAAAAAAAAGLAAGLGAARKTPERNEYLTKAHKVQPRYSLRFGTRMRGSAALT